MYTLSALLIVRRAISFPSVIVVKIIRCKMAAPIAVAAEVGERNHSGVFAGGIGS